MQQGSSRIEVEYFLKNLLDLIRLPFNSLAIIQSMTFTSEFRLIDHPKNHIWSLITKKSKITLTLVKMNAETGNRWSVYTSLYRLFCNKIRIKLGPNYWASLEVHLVGFDTFRKVILTIFSPRIERGESLTTS